MAKRPVPLYDFAAFGQAIKGARTGRNESRKKVSDEMNISPRYLVNIANKGQQPSLQIFYELVTRYDISADQFFFPEKTDGKMLVSSFGCSAETADIEFRFTLSQALDKGNNLAHHLIQSFEPGKTTPEQAHEIGRQLADAVTKGQYEYVLMTHIDKGHIHNHVIFCAVNFVDHHKYNSNKRTYYGIRNMSDKLCRENGLSVVVPGKGSKGKAYIIRGAYKSAIIDKWSDFAELMANLIAKYAMELELWIENHITRFPHGYPVGGAI